MIFIFGFIIGLYVGVFAMSVKFKKQLKKMETTVHMPATGTAEEIFSAEDLTETLKTKED